MHIKQLEYAMIPYLPEDLNFRGIGGLGVYDHLSGDQVIFVSWTLSNETTPLPNQPSGLCLEPALFVLLVRQEEERRNVIDS